MVPSTCSTESNVVAMATYGYNKATQKVKGPSEKDSSLQSSFGDVLRMGGLAPDTEVMISYPLCPVALHIL